MPLTQKIIIIKAKSSKIRIAKEKCFIYEAPSIQLQEMLRKRTIGKAKESVFSYSYAHKFKLHNAVLSLEASHCWLFLHTIRGGRKGRLEDVERFHYFFKWNCYDSIWNARDKNYEIFFKNLKIIYKAWNSWVTLKINLSSRNLFLALISSSSSSLFPSPFH